MRCGVGDYTYQLALTLASDPSVRVAVLTSRAAASCEPPRNLAFFPIIDTWRWNELSKILDVIRSWAPDHVHIQYPTLGYGSGLLPWLLPLYLRLSKIPVVQTWHEVFTPRVLVKFGLVFKFLSQAVVPGRLIVVRENYRKHTSALLRWAYLGKTVRFIPNASAIPTVNLNPIDRAELRSKYAGPNVHIVVYFGFIAPSKRVEILFQVANPQDSHLVIIGDSFREQELGMLPPDIRRSIAAYHQSLRDLGESQPWKGKVTMTGFLPAEEVARVIAAADAVVLPFLRGAGEWSTTIHGAQAQGTFVLTTSKQRRGYDPEANTYFSDESDLEDMRRALKQHIGVRSKRCNTTARAWQSIGRSHSELYRLRP